jgi:carboxymethylenebutenolidase
MAERLAGLGYFVLLPNVFYRSGEVAPFDPITVWGDEKERTRLFALLGSVTLAQAMNDTGSYLDAMSAQKGVRADSLAVMGYCMGGRWAFAAAGHHPTRVKAAASFHGGNLITDKPDSPHLLADKIGAKLYFGVADDDGSCTPAHQGALATALAQAHVHYQLELYPGAKHGFAVNDTPAYDAAACSRHWTRLQAFLGEALTPS